MDAFFLSYCSVCDKSLESSPNGLYCSEECRLRDACDKNSPIVHHGPCAKQVTKSLNYPSVLKCPYRYCQEPSNSAHSHSHAVLHSHSHSAFSRMEASNVPGSLPDLSLSEDDESASEEYDIPALSLEDKVYSFAR